jgi:hypothetical protein
LRRRSSRLFVVVALVTAALITGAAVFAPTAYACSLIGVSSPEQLVVDSEIIVIGRVTKVEDHEFDLAPEAFLKGPASAGSIRFRDSFLGACPTVALEPGTRLLVYVGDASKPQWPFVNSAYVLKDGRATLEGDRERSESEVVSAVRAVTGQYAVPATSGSDGAGIDWRSTVLPVGAALLAVFAIGLVLMRQWHKIDPT